MSASPLVTISKVGHVAVLTVNNPPVNTLSVADGKIVPKPEIPEGPGKIPEGLAEDGLPT